jgi:hypothetical protein
MMENGGRWELLSNMLPFLQELSITLMVFMVQQVYNLCSISFQMNSIPNKFIL